MNKHAACRELLTLKSLADKLTGGLDVSNDLLSEAILVFLESSQDFISIEHAKRFVAKTMWQMVKQQKNAYNAMYNTINECDVLEQYGIAASEIIQHGMFREYVNEPIVFAAISRLSEDEKTLIELRMTGLTYEAIAEHTNQTKSRVYDVISKAQVKIRKFLNIPH